jgi:hypothetical protein
VAWVEHHGGGFRIRYRLDDGILVSETGFETTSAARARANDVESDQRRGTLTDPRAGQTLLSDWVQTWAEAHDFSPGTWAKYQSRLRNHILPKFGVSAPGGHQPHERQSVGQDIAAGAGRTDRGHVVTLLSMVLLTAAQGHHRH